MYSIKATGKEAKFFKSYECSDSLGVATSYEDVELSDSVARQIGAKKAAVVVYDRPSETLHIYNSYDLCLRSVKIVKLASLENT